jgi:hypothetical protein
MVVMVMIKKRKLEFLRLDMKENKTLQKGKILGVLE